MMKYILTLLFLFQLTSSSTAQNQFKYGFEFQAYPTGIIPGITMDFVFSDNFIGHIRGGYNLVRHRDLGVHDDERGGGFGGSAGLRYYFDYIYDGWFTAVRTDLWFNKIDWKDRIGAINQTSGSTKVTVLQPTLVGGYTFELGALFFSPTIGLGYEINVKTEGQEVGQGPILLLGFMLNI